MATGTVATAAGAAMLLYFVLSRRLSGRVGDEDPDGELSKLNRSGRRRIARRPAQAPVTWFEFMASLSETIRFTYSETLGKWPIGDLAFGINYLMRRQVRNASRFGLPDLILSTEQLVRCLCEFVRSEGRPTGSMLRRIFSVFSDQEKCLASPTAYFHSLVLSFVIANIAPFRECEWINTTLASTNDEFKDVMRLELNCKHY